MYWSRDENGFAADAAKPFVSYAFRDGLLDIHVAAERIDISVEEFEELMEKEENK